MEITVQVNLEIGESSKLFISGLIGNLLKGMVEDNAKTNTVNCAPAQAVNQAPVIPIQTAPIAPIVAAPVAPITPTVVPIQQAAPVVPVTPVSYTQEQLAFAATSLVDAGRMVEIQNLLAGFGVTSLVQLPKEQYGNFAAQLRAMGVQI